MTFSVKDIGFVIIHSFFSTSQTFNDLVTQLVLDSTYILIRI